MSRRLERVNELIREELGVLILRTLRDPRLDGLVSVTGVRTAPDLAHATVYISVLGEPATRAAAVKALRQASGFLRHELREKIELRRVPALDFREDDSLDRGLRVTELLSSIPPLPPEESEPAS